MPYHRGDVIAVPYDYSDLTSGKVNRRCDDITRYWLRNVLQYQPANFHTRFFSQHTQPLLY